LKAVRQQIVQLQGQANQEGEVEIIGEQQVIKSVANLDVIKEAIKKLSDQETELLKERNKLAEDADIELARLAGETAKIIVHDEKEKANQIEKVKEAMTRLEDSIEKDLTAKRKKELADRFLVFEHEIGREVKAQEKAADQKERVEQATTRLEESIFKERTSQFQKDLKFRMDQITGSIKVETKDIIDSYNIQFKAQQAHIERTLRLDENAYKQKLEKYQISQHQFDQLVKQATDRAYGARITAIDKELKAYEQSQNTQKKGYAELIAEKERLQDEWDLRVQESVAKETTAWKDWSGFTMGALSSVAGAMRQHHAAQVALMIAEAGLKMGLEIAEGLKALAQPIPDTRAAALHFASAAEFGVVAGMNAASGGGGGGSSSQRVPAGGYPSNSPNGLPPAMSAGGGYGGGNVHVVVMGQSEGASYIAGMINDSVRYGGTQLTASHLVNPGSPT
jgi:hypothetical protein